MDRGMARGEPFRAECRMKRLKDIFTSDRIVALALHFAALGAFVAALLLKLTHDGVGAGTFPLVVACCFLFFSALNAVFAFRAKTDAPRGSLSSVLWIGALLLGLCAALLLHVPFWIVCPVFLFVASFVVLKQKWLSALIAAVVTTGLIYLVFAVLFRVPLP